MLAGDAWYRSGRRLGNVNAATQTIQTQTTPARTPSASHVWNVVASTLHTSMIVTRHITVRIAGTGECRRSPTSASFSGSSRSNAQANTVRTGMNEFPTMAGRLQNRNEPTISTVSTGTFTVRAERKWYQGPDGILYAGFPPVFTADMNEYPATLKISSTPMTMKTTSQVSAVNMIFRCLFL